MLNWQFNQHSVLKIPETLPSFDHLAISLLKCKPYLQGLWEKFFFYENISFRFRVSVTPSQPGHPEAHFLVIETPDLNLGANINTDDLPESWNELSFEFKQVIEFMLIKQVHES